MNEFTSIVLMWTAMLSCILLPLLGVAGPLSQKIPDTVFLEELTWTEVRDAIKAGNTSIIFPTGGTEQNGPHLILGKHNYIVKHTAEQIARRLGNALVAPVLAYVPEGDLDPPAGHMLFPGTITLPNEYFMKVAEYAARSFKVNGFKDIILLGDSDKNQAGLEAVAEMLSREWANTDVRVHYVSDYYYGGSRILDWLEEQGESLEDIGQHAGLVATSILLAIDATLIREARLEPSSNYDEMGFTGNPSRASVAYGQKALAFKIEAALVQIENLMSE